MNTQVQNPFGWGRADALATDKELKPLLQMLQMLTGQPAPAPVSLPDPSQITIRKPRFRLSDSLTFCTDDHLERLLHSKGQSFIDTSAKQRGQFQNPPDYVALPGTEKELELLFRFAEKEGIALIPFGGGSSVTGGVEGRQLPATIAVDMRHFDKVQSVNQEAQTAVIQAGIFGPALEAGLKAHGYTLRFFPQSFEYSTLGGWIATHAGGHFSTVYTHIDELTQSVRMLTPSGVVEGCQFPYDATGPSERSLTLGSEGTMGIITEAVMRIRPVPVYRAKASVRFPDFNSGVAACRALAQSGLNPANARLIDPLEAFANGAGDGQTALLVLAFESAICEVDHLLDQALSICKNHRGATSDADAKDSGEQAWKKGFIRAPYIRDGLVRRGYIVETFETCITWDRFADFDQAICKALADKMKEMGLKGAVTRRFTHLYPDGPAPYYSVIALGDPQNQIEEWQAIKACSLKVLAKHHASVTHHHAVGRDHRDTLQQMRSPLVMKALHAAKSALDPNGIMNPGVLWKK